MRFPLLLALFSVLSACGYSQARPEDLTKSEQERRLESLSVVSYSSRLSDDLVSRLTERVKQTEDSELNFKRIIEEYKARWMSSELGWEQSRMDHEVTLSLLSGVETSYESLKISSEDRAKKDAEKIKQLELDIMKTAALWAAGGVVVGFLVGLAF